MPKADIATLSPVLLIASLALPAIVGKAISKRPMDLLLMGIPMKIVAGLLLWVAVASTKAAYAEGTPGILYFGPLLSLLLLNEIAGSLIFLSFMSFFSKVSDPVVGGCYMTLLNTLSNLGSKWPNLLSLWLLPKMTYYYCQLPRLDNSVGFSGPCSVDKVVDSVMTVTECEEKEGHCVMWLDGYTFQSVACLALGIAWCIIFQGKLRYLQSLPTSAWWVTMKNSNRSEPSKNY